MDETLDVYDARNYNEAGLLLGIEAGAMAGPSSAACGDGKKKKKKVVKEKKKSQTDGEAHSSQQHEEEEEAPAARRLSRCQKKRIKKKEKMAKKLAESSQQLQNEVEDSHQNPQEEEEEVEEETTAAADESSVVPQMKDEEWDEETSRRYQYTDDEIQILPNPPPPRPSPIRWSPDPNDVIWLSDSDVELVEDVKDPNALNSEIYDHFGAHRIDRRFGSTDSPVPPAVTSLSTPEEALNPAPVDSAGNAIRAPATQTSDDIFNSSGGEEENEEAAEEEINRDDGDENATFSANGERLNDVCFTPPSEGEDLRGRDFSTILLSDSTSSTQLNTNEDLHRRDFSTILLSDSTSSTQLNTNAGSRGNSSNTQESDGQAPIPPPRDYDRDDSVISPLVNRRNDGRSPIPPPRDYDRDDSALSPLVNRNKRNNNSTEVIVDSSLDSRQDVGQRRTPSPARGDYENAGGFDSDFSPPSGRGGRSISPTILIHDGVVQTQQQHGNRRQETGNGTGSETGSPRAPTSGGDGGSRFERSGYNSNFSPSPTDRGRDVVDDVGGIDRDSSPRNELDRDGGSGNESDRTISLDDEDESCLEPVKKEESEDDEDSEDEDEDDVLILPPSPPPPQRPLVIPRVVVVPSLSPSPVRQIPPPQVLRPAPKRPAGNARKNAVPQKKARTVAPPTNPNGNNADPGIRPYEREIRRLQRTTKLMIPRLCFSRLVKEVTEQVTQQYSTLAAPPKWQSLALTAVQEASELYLTNLFGDSYKLTGHAKRTTLMPSDVQLIIELRGLKDPGHP